MDSAAAIEARRLREQDRLDRLKSASERNQLGQFATPPGLAQCLARYASGMMPGGSVRLLDPAVGTGSFFSAALNAFGGRLRNASGIELDPGFARVAATLWGAHGLEVTQGDFTRLPAPEQRFNLVLTNPPYIRHHHLGKAEKARLKERLARSLQLEISGLAGFYCYFLLLSHDWMMADGIGIWLIPSEFMDVSYGVALRRYLSEHVTLIHIHRFRPEDVQFDDALVTSAVVVFRKSPPPADHVARFSFGGPVDAPHKEIAVARDSLRSSQKWGRFSAGESGEKGAGATLGDIFAIKRGLATGANKFFIVSERDVEALQIPSRFAKPILPSPRHLRADIIEALHDGAPDVSPKLFLLDCDEPESRVRANWPKLFEYFEAGKKQAIHEAYLASRRAPWYSQERRPAAPFLCTYMGRAREGGRPFRLFWNKSRATAHNVYLMLYPTGMLQRALDLDPSLYREVFAALKRIETVHFIAEGRIYGGGLHKLEPRELARVSAGPVLASIPGWDGRARQVQIPFAL